VSERSGARCGGQPLTVSYWLSESPSAQADRWHRAVAARALGRRLVLRSRGGDLIPNLSLLTLAGNDSGEEPLDREALSRSAQVSVV
jgi:hypothetical protein